MTHFTEESEAATQAVASMDKVATHLAHGALRTMSMKIVLLVYCVTCEFCDMYWQRVPLAIVLFCIIIVPKMTTITWDNKLISFVEIVASILQ